MAEKKFIVTPKVEKTMTITLRIDNEVLTVVEQLVVKSGRSRNELINKALKFALDNVEFVDKQKT